MESLRTRSLKKGETEMSKNWKWLLLLAGIFSVFAGFQMLANPAISLASMTFLFALVFVVQGISEIVNYLKQKKSMVGTCLAGL